MKRHNTSKLAFGTIAVLALMPGMASAEVHTQSRSMTAPSATVTAAQYTANPTTQIQTKSTSKAARAATGEIQVAQRRGRGMRMNRGLRGRGFGRRNGVAGQGYNRGFRRGGNYGFRRRYGRRGFGSGIGLGIAAAAIIGGSIAVSRNRHRDRWEMCDDRYRTFRWTDGTYIPYVGAPRELCPYLR